MAEAEGHRDGRWRTAPAPTGKTLARLRALFPQWGQASETERKVWPSPSAAIEHEACAVCLGGGTTLDIVLGRVGACSACGGSGALSDMLAGQCNDPACPDHGRG